MIAERVKSAARDFTPFTPFSGFSVQALISRWFAVVRMHSRGRIWSLFSIAYQIPKRTSALFSYPDPGHKGRRLAAQVGRQHQHGAHSSHTEPEWSGCK